MYYEITYEGVWIETSADVLRMELSTEGAAKKLTLLLELCSEKFPRVKKKLRESDSVFSLLR